MVLIDALFINKGGGAVLLEYLIEKTQQLKNKEEFFFLLDPRFNIPKVLTANFVVIPNKLSERIKFYKQNSNKFSKVFCFANTPPPIKLNVPTFTYMHNQKILEAPYRKFEKNYFKLYLKYLVVKFFNKNTDFYIVQTPHMIKEILKLRLKDATHCLKIPFYNSGQFSNGYIPFMQRPIEEFVFISNPSPQKNYPTLLDAWEYLLEMGHKPVLHVTIDDTAPDVLNRMNEIVAKGAKIVNHVNIDPRELYFFYRYMIFPSIMESYGLPLIEATEAGMKVLASDMPYVHDVIIPSFTFEPMSKQSIANAVLTALNVNLPFPTLVTKNEIERLFTILAEN